jgi:predicted dehydrogenase
MQERATVVAVADESIARAKGDISGSWGNLGDGPQKVDFSKVAGTTSWRELIAMSDVDVVDICVPTPFHLEIVEAALAAGKHVLCEKPMARTSADAEAMVRAASKAQTFFMPAMCMRFWPEWAWLKEAIASNRYGRVLSASFLRQGTMPPGWYKNGAISGGALLDLHIHDTDFVCHLFGKPRAVSSRGYISGSGQPDHLSTQYFYDDVPLVVADGGWAFAEPYPFRMRYTVNFQNNATVDFDLGREDKLIVYENGKANPIPCEAIDGWQGEIRYFVDCVSKNKKPETVTAEDGALSLRVIEAEARSLTSNATQPV